MFSSAYTERGLPQTLIPQKTKVIVPGIVQEQIQVIQQNTIPSPTPAGTEIQIYLPQLINTFLDCQSAYLVFHVITQWNFTAGYGAGFPATSNDLNGALIGSFYSIFYRLTVYANSVNVTDDIIEVGIIAARLLQLTMTRTARDGMAWLLGFNASPFCNSGLLGYKVRGQFPYGADGDNLALMNNSTSVGANYILGSGSALGNGLAGAGIINQQYDFAVPMLGSLGINNPNMYYMGLGNTRISLFTENPNNIFFLPPAFTTSRALAMAPGGVGGPSVQQSIRVGGYALAVFAVTRVRFEANIVRLDQGIMGEISGMLTSTGGSIVNRCISFQTTTQQIQLGSSGTQQPSLNLRRGCMKSVLTCFNNTGNSTSTLGGLNGANPEVNVFNKYGSINPGLGANTMLLINNVSYPKLGLNPTQFPSETFAYILDGLGLFSSDSAKPDIPFQNWLCADPAVISSGMGTLCPTGTADLSAGSTSFWRSGAFQQGIGVGAAMTWASTTNLNGQNNVVQTNPSYFWAQAPQYLMSSAAMLGSGFTYCLSNDFFLYFSLEDTPRPGLLSGKNTMDGSNYLNIPLVATTSYTYNVYFIGIFDALIVHDITQSNVYMIS